MRPRYENEQDRANEKRVALAAACEWQAVAMKLPHMYSLDWAFFRDGQLKAWVEVKCRKIPFGRFPTLILSAHKFDFGLNYASRFKAPFILLADFTDGIYWWKADDSVDLPVRIGGRSDRKDWQDTEPVIEIPIHLFRKLT